MHLDKVISIDQKKDQSANISYVSDLDGHHLM